MADISIHDECMDDSDEGFEQGDCPPGGPGDDAALPPLLRIQKYAESGNIFDRQLVVRLVLHFLKTVPAEILVEDLPEIMKILTRIGDELMLRADLLEQIPPIFAQAVECSSKVQALRNVVNEYLIPLVVRNLGSSDTAVDKAAHATLIKLIKQGFITKQQAEIQVCPSILALLKVDPISDINTGAVRLMSKLAPLLGRDVTERIFLKRFSELCANHMFFVRKVCAAHFGEFCAVVGRDAFENILLPCYITLCGDGIWGVRKACAEVVMFVSCACPPIARKLLLAPVFAKLLQDDCRWVKMSAFETLGPFISTFADPTVTNVGYNKATIEYSYNQGGDLILVNGDGSEFFINCPSSISETQPPLTHKFVLPLSNEREDVDVIMNRFDTSDYTIEDLLDVRLIGESPISESANETVNEEVLQPEIKENEIIEDIAPPINDQEIDEFLKEVVETVKNAVLSCRTVEIEQGVIGERNPRDHSMDSISNANVITEIKPCDNLADTINNELADDMKGLNINTKEEPVIDNSSSNVSNNTSQSLLNPKRSNTATTNSDSNEPSIIDVKKVNFINSQSGTREDDDLHSFNSHNYWYISPDLPLDPSIIAGVQSPKERSGTGDVASHLEDLYSTINLNDSLDTTQYDLTISFEENSNGNLSTDLECKVVHIKQEQDVVPQLLIDHFISMTDPAVNLDNEMRYHCAFSLPAVALTLGSNNWHLLKNTVDCLASDMQYKVRRTVASGLHELALILGPEITTNNLAPLFDGFIKDLDEVRIGIIKNLAHFLRLINPTKRNTYLPRLVEFLQTDNEWNWRFREELAKQLLLAVTLFKPADTAKHIGIIARDLLCDKVAAVREVALSLVTEIIRYTSSEQGLTANFLVKLAECFAHSKKWKRRQTFALLCVELLKEDALPPEQFASEILPHLLDLSWDPVANVRLVVARCLAKHIMPIEYFCNPTNELYDVLEKVLRRLQADKDRDVRQCAEVEQTALVNY